MNETLATTTRKLSSGARKNAAIKGAAATETPKASTPANKAIVLSWATIAVSNSRICSTAMPTPNSATTLVTMK